MANIQIVAMIGSSRPGNAAAKALAVTVDELRQNSDVAVDVVDPAEIDLRAHRIPRWSKPCKRK